MARKPPFAERGGTLRGAVDIASGSYPGFIIGGGLGDILPVFHFHQVTPQSLEPYLDFLNQNKYRTVTSEDILRFVKEGKHPGTSTVALCFDDAWASLWTVAAPLLRKYDLRAITYVIPARVKDSRIVRPTMDEAPFSPGREDESETPFATWPELLHLSRECIVDIQCHTLSHSMIYCSSSVIGFVTPEFLHQPLLGLPLLETPGGNVFLDERHIGAPVYPLRSRMSGARRFRDNPLAREECIAHVAGNGGRAFFDRDGWRDDLLSTLGNSGELFESDDERRLELERELRESREMLNKRLDTDTVRHLCFPWGVAGSMALKVAREAGYESAFSDHMFGRRFVRRGDNPYRMMRLPNCYIFRLPGIRRRPLISILADRGLFRKKSVL